MASSEINKQDQEQQFADWRAPEAEPPHGPEKDSRGNLRLIRGGVDEAEKVQNREGRDDVKELEDSLNLLKQQLFELDSRRQLLADAERFMYLEEETRNQIRLNSQGLKAKGDLSRVQAKLEPMEQQRQRREQGNWVTRGLRRLAENPVQVTKQQKEYIAAMAEKKRQEKLIEETWAQRHDASGNLMDYKAMSKERDELQKQLRTKLEIVVGKQGPYFEQFVKNLRDEVASSAGKEAEIRKQMVESEGKLAELKATP